MVLDFKVHLFIGSVGQAGHAPLVQGQQRNMTATQARISAQPIPRRAKWPWEDSGFEKT